MVRHWTPKPVASGRATLEVTSFFALVECFEYKIAISSNFVQTVKNSNVFQSKWQHNASIAADARCGFTIIVC